MHCKTPTIKVLKLDCIMSMCRYRILLDWWLEEEEGFDFLFRDFRLYFLCIIHLFSSHQIVCISWGASLPTPSQGRKSLLEQDVDLVFISVFFIKGWQNCGQGCTDRGTKFIACFFFFVLLPFQRSRGENS